MNKHAPKKVVQEDWHPADIKAALSKLGLTLSRVAFDSDLKDSTSLSACLKRPMPANETRIAAALGIPACTIWPSRYQADGQPAKRGRNAMNVTAEMRASKAADKSRKILESIS